MATGLLEVSGYIDLDQFWPRGSSDADTVKVTLDNRATAFRFRRSPGDPFTTTQAFDGAIVRGRGRSPAIKTVHGEDQLTIRLQGVDAPELHYRPPALLPRSQQTARQRAAYLRWNLEYRQHLGESATVALHDLLASARMDPLRCRVTTAVDEPDEVFDVYGRFVGDVWVTLDGNEVDINTWLVAQGWAFPAFYVSMSEEEIEILLAAAGEAWEHGRGVWGWFPDYVGTLDFDLEYRRPSGNPVIDPVADAGEVIFPKLFRRLSTWAVGRRSKMTTLTYKRYLESKPDYCYLLDDFLEQGLTAATPRRLDEFVESDGYFSVWPEQLVFQEAPSRLTAPNGGDAVW